MSDAKKLCRSRGPEGEQCAYGRGHTKPKGMGIEPLHQGDLKSWEGGIKTPPHYSRNPQPSDDVMTEADYQTWGRFL